MYRDNSGIEHESYEAACHYYGVDTPDQIEAEEAMWAEIEAREAQDEVYAYNRAGKIHWRQFTLKAQREYFDAVEAEYAARDGYIPF